MEQSLYPAASKEISQKRKDLAPEILAAFQSFSQRVFADGGAAFEDEGAHRGCGGACHAVPILHPRPHQTRNPEGCDGTRDHGSDLGYG